MPPGVIEPHTEPVVPQVSCQVREVFVVPVTLAANCTVWKVSIFITFVVMDTVIGVLEPPPPPPQDTIVMAPATTRMLSRQARLIMESSLQSDVEFTRGATFSTSIGRAGIWHDRIGNLWLCTCLQTRAANF